MVVGAGSVVPWWALSAEHGYACCFLLMITSLSCSNKHARPILPSGVAHIRLPCLMFADFSVLEKSRLDNYVLIRTAKLVQMSHKTAGMFMSRTLSYRLNVGTAPPCFTDKTPGRLIRFRGWRGYMSCRDFDFCEEMRPPGLSNANGLAS